ncbi:hypothetical protein [Paraburkholderia dilworthii]|uniref:hypothetical protein n=1 Tax=Paraburkholderia dilworthii TaxID=948106 RepID=UPI00055CE854|nr:hypothetical protein [Paraburkholderia dilworthii]
MHEPVTVPAHSPVIGLARCAHAIDALCGAIVGFALLAGTRAFMFTALLGWREPVLGGAGLALLALVGWLRWRCGCAPAAGRGACEQIFGARRNLSEARNVACYNRLPQCEPFE